MLFYLEILLILFIFHGIGALMVNSLNLLKSKEIFLAAFVNLIVGMLISIFLYSLIKTNGHTVNILLPIILTPFYLTYKNQIRFSLPNFKAKDIISSCGLIFLISLILFIIQGSYYYSTPFNKVPHGDHVMYYSKIIDFMNINGVESRFEALKLIADFDFPTPYHYPELWLSAMISSYFGVLSLESLHIGSFVILNTTLVIGLFVLIRRFILNKVAQLFAVLFLLLICGIKLSNIVPQVDSYILSISWNPKLIFPSIFLILALILYIEKSRLYVLSLVLLPIFNITYAPAIFTSLFLGGLIYLRNGDKSNARLLTYSSFFCAFLIVIFYFFASKGMSNGEVDLSLILLGHSFDYLKPFKIIIGTLFVVFQIYLPYFIAIIPLILFTDFKTIFLKKIQKNIGIIFFFSIVFIFSLIFWSLLHPMADSMQFFYMPSILMLNILVGILFLSAWKYLLDNRSFFGSITIVLSLTIFSYNIIQLSNTPFFKNKNILDEYSLEYINNIKNTLPKPKSDNEINLIASIKSEKNMNSYWEAIPSSTNDYFLRLFVSNYYGISLNALNTPLKFDNITNLRIQNNLKADPFFVFCQKDEYSSYDINTLQTEFIMLHQIKYLQISKGSEFKIAKLEQYIDTTFIDKVSGEKFIFLKY